MPEDIQPVTTISPTPTATLVPTPTPTPTAKECLIELSSPKETQNGRTWFDEWWSVLNGSGTRKIFTGSAANHPCTEQLMSTAYNNCMNDSNSWAHHKIPTDQNWYPKWRICRRGGTNGMSSIASFEDYDQQFLDDSYLMPLLFDINNKARYDAMIDFDRSTWNDANWWNDWQWWLNNVGGSWSDIFKLKAHYMDNNCKLIKNFDPNKYRVCSNLTIDFILSPISLVWDPQFSIEDALTFTTFALGPQHGGKWYSWHAGPKTPLLVFDPEHKGVITSGRQLFGSWTFGGKAAASIGGAADIRGEWENGYEALGTLDVDGNEKLSDAELEPLGLWFDENQDGVSQPGEVKPLAELGITAIFTKPDYRDANGNIHAHRGYERVIEGRQITGASVDWYAKSYSTLLEAVQRWRGSAELDSSSSPYAAGAKPGDEEFSDMPDEANDPSGYWHWTASDDSGKLQGQGVLQLRQVKNGSSIGIAGYSIAEQLVESQGSLPDGRKIKSIMRRYPILGAQYAAEDGGWRLTFATGGENKMVTISGASMSKDGEELTGESIAQVEKGRRPKGVRYSWKAKRL